MKKIICVLTALAVFALFLCPMCVFAAEDPEFAVDSVNAEAGGKAEVNVFINNNPGIISAKLSVEFDDALKLTGVKYGDELGGKTSEPPKLTSPVTLNWLILDTNPQNMDKDTVYATLTFDLADVKPGEYNVKVSYEKGNVYNAEEKDVEFKTVPGVITVAADDGVDGAAPVTTTGDIAVSDDAGHPEGDGDYTGGTEIIEGDGAASSADADKAETESTSFADVLGSVWFIAPVAVILAAVITVVVIKLKKGKKLD